jgi:hypothetical protein
MNDKKEYSTRYTEDMWISSVDSDHLELVFLVFSEAFNSTYTDKQKFIPLEFGLFTSKDVLNFVKNIE